MLQNDQMTYFCEKSDQTLGQIISGNKCDRDKLIFSAESGAPYAQVGNKKEPKWDWKMPKSELIPEMSKPPLSMLSPIARVSYQIQLDSSSCKMYIIRYIVC